MQKKFSNEVEEHRKKYKDAMHQVKAKETQIREQKDHFNEKLQEHLQERLKTEREQLVVSSKQRSKKSRKIVLL